MFENNGHVHVYSPGAGDCPGQISQRQVICVFVFAYAKSRFSHDKAQMIKGKKMDTFQN